MRPSPGQLSAALRAASECLPEGDLMLQLIVVSEHEGDCYISSSSNITAPSVRVKILQFELDRAKEGVS